MSQVKFETKHPSHGRLEVVAGWDHPLGHYHLTFYLLDAPDDHPDDGVLWSNLELPSGGYYEAEQVWSHVEEGMGIQPPLGWRERVARQEGNVFYRWSDAQGWSPTR